MSKETATSVNRKKEIVSAAIEVFAEIGYYRATTAQVAERASISQPYVYRFFTKESLLVEALGVAMQRILQAFEDIITTAPMAELESRLIGAYEQIMQAHRNEILLQIQAYTIREEPVRDAMRRGMEQIQRTVHQAFEQAGIAEAAKRTSDFLARGILCNVAMALDMPDLMAKN